MRYARPMSDAGSRTGDPTARRATLADLAAVPDHQIGELVDGELIVSPRPAARHALATSVLGAELGSGFHRPPGDAGGPGGWWLLFEPELHLGEDVVVPDLAGWRRERMPRIPDVAAFDLAPDWICEVVSPTTAGLDRVRKMRIYGREQVPCLWLVDPVARTLEAYGLEGDRWTVVVTHAGDVRVRVPPFEALELDLARWWME